MESKVRASWPTSSFALHVNRLIQIAGLADLFGHVNEAGERFGDAAGGSEGDEYAKTNCEERTDHSRGDGSDGGALVFLLLPQKQFVVLLVHAIENVAGAGYPGVGIFLEIENLKFGDGGVAAIDGAALFGERSGKLGGPSLLQFLKFFEAAVLIGIRQFLGVADGFAKQPLALGHLVEIADIAAQQIVLEMKAVLHHLEAHRGSSLGEINRALGGSLGLVFAADRQQVHREQNQHSCQNDAEIEIKLFSDGHASAFLAPRRHRSISVAGCEAELQTFCCFRTCFEAPALDRVHDRIGQNRVPTNQARLFHSAVGGDRYLHLYDAGNPHSPSQFGIRGGHGGFGFSFVDCLSPSMRSGVCGPSTCQHKRHRQYAKETRK